MKTEDLIAVLASRVDAVEPRVSQRRYAMALGWGALGAALIMVSLFGVRPDLAEAARLPMFWAKLAFPAALFAGALLAVMRLSRPGVRLGYVPAALIAPVLAWWLLAATVLLTAAPGERAELLLGHSWSSCSFAIALLAVPMLSAALWAMKGLAPIRPALAGGAAGFLAGAGGALVYALYCVEMAAPFIAVWYLLGMLIPAGLGSMLGPRLLRW